MRHRRPRSRPGVGDRRRRRGVWRGGRRSGEPQRAVRGEARGRPEDAQHARRRRHGALLVARRRRDDGAAREGLEQRGAARARHLADRVSPHRAHGRGSGAARSLRLAHAAEASSACGRRDRRRRAQGGARRHPEAEARVVVGRAEDLAPRRGREDAAGPRSRAGLRRPQGHRRRARRVGHAPRRGGRRPREAPGRGRLRRRRRLHPDHDDPERGRRGREVDGRDEARRHRAARGDAGERGGRAPSARRRERSRRSGQGDGGAGDGSAGRAPRRGGREEAARSRCRLHESPGRRAERGAPVGRSAGPAGAGHGAGCGGRDALRAGRGRARSRRSVQGAAARG